MNRQRGPAALPAIPPRALALITTAVLLGHFLMLQVAPGSLLMNDPVLTRSFSTRVVEIDNSVPPTPPGAIQVPRKAATPRVPVAVQAAGPDPVTAPTPLPPEAQAPAAVTASSTPVNTVTAAEPAPLPLTPAATPPERPRREDGPRVSNFAVPGSVRLKFVVSGQRGTQPLSGVSGELLWLQDGKQYEAKLTLSFLFKTLRTQISAGRIGADGLAPVRFFEKTSRELAAHFDRDAGKVTFSANTPDAALLSGAQDRLSAALQLSAMLAGDPAKFPQATTITLQTISAREADNWLFTVEGEEKLQLPIGEVTALKVTRNPRRPFDQKVELWFAPTMDYLPVRLRLTEANGDFADQQLRASDRP